MRVSRRVGWLVVSCVLATICLSWVAVSYLAPPSHPLPEPGSERYLEYLENLQIAVSALESNAYDLALEKLTTAIREVPEEPAAWANRGLFYLRRNDLKAAERDLRRAKALAPDDAEIEALLGHLAVQTGHPESAIAHLSRAVTLDPRNVVTLYAFADRSAEEGTPEGDSQSQRALEALLEIQPYNLHALMKHAQLAQMNGDLAALRNTLERLEKLAPRWSARSRDELAMVINGAGDGPRELQLKVTRLRIMVMGEHGYTRDSRKLMPFVYQTAHPITRLVRLKQPRPSAAPADMELRFAVTALPAEAGADRASCDALQVVWGIRQNEQIPFKQFTWRGGMDTTLADALEPTIVQASARGTRVAGELHLEYPSGRKRVAPSGAGIVAFDWDNDRQTDLLLAGAGGLRFATRGHDGAFVDATAATELGGETLNADYFGAWAADIDSNGLLDVVAARRVGSPLVLRNRGDSTFELMHVPEFDEVKAVRAFVCANLNDDRVCDAVFLDDAGKLHVFKNHGWAFATWPLPADVGDFLAVTAADVSGEGHIDIVALRTDGALLRIFHRENSASWESQVLAQVPLDAGLAPGDIALFVEDLDNNGALDLIVAGPREARILLGDERFRFQPLPAAVPMRVCVVLDLDGDGWLDLLGVAADGLTVQAHGRGLKQYRSQSLHVLGHAFLRGSGMNNSFAIGGVVRSQAGLMRQTHRIVGPTIHVGLGNHTAAMLLHLVWPNGTDSWEFRIPSEQRLLAMQRNLGW